MRSCWKSGADVAGGKFESKAVDTFLSATGELDKVLVAGIDAAAKNKGQARRPYREKPLRGGPASWSW